MDLKTRMQVSRQRASGSKSNVIGIVTPKSGTNIFVDTPRPTPPSAASRKRRKGRRNKLSRGERLRQKHERKQRADRIKILVRDYDLSAEQQKLIKLRNSR